jgi:3-deoxy-D-manno-octulosonic-acid transferase
MPPLLMDLLYVPLALAYLPVLLYQMLVLKKNRRGWGERLGFVPRRQDRRPCIWIHAVSLGEINATPSLVSEIEKRLPGYDIVISTTTDTGHAAARKRYVRRLVFRYPLDFSFIVRRVMNRIRPSAIVLLELETWPNLLALARRRGIPVGIANGRVTEERSMRRFRRPVIRGLARRMFADLAWIGAQDETYAARFAELGASRERIAVTGSLKYDTAVIADRVAGDEALALALGLDCGKPLWVAGSTGPGEEEMVLRAFAGLRGEFPDLQLAIIPRKPERFEEAARLIAAQGCRCVRRSERPDASGGDGTARANDAGQPTTGTPAARADAATVFLGDTMGELRKFYALADVVFVGRSLAPMGGSDLMEVAGLGRAMCFGPHVENFADVAGQLTAAGGAVQLAGEADLTPTVRRLLARPEEARRMGGLAQEVVRRNTGATRRTIDLLCRSLVGSAAGSA